jgi:hypothetical protein
MLLQKSALPWASNLDYESDTECLRPSSSCPRRARKAYLRSQVARKFPWTALSSADEGASGEFAARIETLVSVQYGKQANAAEPFERAFESVDVRPRWSSRARNASCRFITAGRMGSGFFEASHWIPESASSDRSESNSESELSEASSDEDESSEPNPPEVSAAVALPRKSEEDLAAPSELASSVPDDPVVRPFSLLPLKLIPALSPRQIVVELSEFIHQQELADGNVSTALFLVCGH